MPCYSATNVDQQRGNGVFDRSIKGLQALNAVGYGQPGSNLQLDLVYNPNGIFLAPAQSKLEVRHATFLSFTSDTDTLCCAVLCCAVLCCAVLCRAVLCCAVLCCAVSAIPVRTGASF